MKIIGCRGLHCWKKKSCIRYNVQRRHQIASFWPMPPTSESVHQRKCKAYYANIGQRLPKDGVI